MAKGARRAERLESAISVCLLAIIVFIALGIGVKQALFDPAGFNLEQRPVQAGLQKGPDRSDLRDLSGLADEGLTALSQTEIYTTDDLYEKINGKASLYQDSGFETLFTQRFGLVTDPNLWGELYVYEMAGAKAAFSVFSMQRRPDATAPPPLPTTFAYATENALYFTQGSHYVEFIGSDESEKLVSEMLAVANKLRQTLGPQGLSQIPGLSLFPSESLVPGSVKLYLTNAFGYGGLTDTFTARYKMGSEIITAFFSQRRDRQNAKALAQRYHNFLIENGGQDKKTINENLAAEVVDFYGTIEIVTTGGAFLLGVHEADNQDAAEKLVLTLTRELSDLGKKEQ